MRLAREAVTLPEEKRLAWVLRSHPETAVVEKTLRLVLSFDEEADRLGFAVSAEVGAPTPLPAFIGRFKVLGLLGAGSFSRVYRALDQERDRVVALKVLTGPMKAQDAASRFEREVAALSRLHHPAIPPFIDSGSASGEHGAMRWIAIALVEGRPFREAAKNNDERWVATAISEVCRAVQYAHDSGVVHRDLKPSNILIASDSRAHVLDFGVATIRSAESQERLTATGQVVGTIAYMSPEQVSGASPDERSDQFSLAVMLFEALTGKLPHSDGSDGLVGLLSIAEWDGFVSKPLLQEISRDLGDVIVRALEQDPALRYESVGAFADDLDRFLAGQSIRTSHRSSLRTLRKLVGRYRVVVAASLVTGILLTAALVSTVIALDRARDESHKSMALGDLALLPHLLGQVDSLWPQLPQTLPDYDRWLEQASGVLARRPTSSHAAPTGLQRERFDDDARCLPEAIATVQQRRENAAAVMARSVQDRQKDWSDAARRVLEDPRMNGLRLQPQVGLIPLGADPESGLEEFGLVDWGTIPQRHPQTERLVVDEATCPVLVLIPGGAVAFGTPEIPAHEQRLRSGLPLLFNHATFGTRAIQLDSFLVGKYEVTQGHWVLAMTLNRSEWASGEINSGVLMTDRHPVEMVSHKEALTAAHRMGCTLPTEAQWQHAAHPVGRGLYWWPEDTRWADAPENVLDATGSTSVEPPWVNDIHYFHAPVGSFAPNPFGLYDVLGNVQEWCLDPFKVKALQDPTIPLAPKTGEVLADGGGDFSYRGGSFHTAFGSATIPLRHGPPGEIRRGAVGFRLARPLITQD